MPAPPAPIIERVSASQYPPDGDGTLDLANHNGVHDRMNGSAAGAAPPDHDTPVPAHSAVRGWLEAPFFAVRFLTVLPPLLGRRPPEAEDFGRSDAFFPVVGLALGAVLVGVDLLLQSFVPLAVLNVVLVALLALLTGALHLDGVIDTFDGLFSGDSPQKRLAIMRDPRAGSYGVVAVVLVLALKLAALSTLPAGARIPALLLAPCLGRWGIVLATYTFPYARPEGMGRAFKESIRLEHLIVAGAVSSVAAGLVGGITGVAAWSAIGLAVMIGCQAITVRLGGLTGDSYGSICELTEASVLVAFGLRFGGAVG